MLYINVCSLVMFNLFLYSDGKLAFISGKPNPSCIYSHAVLECTTVNLEIPRNFDATKIPADIRTITLDCPNSHANNYCNVIRYRAPPFPPLTQLREVNLYGFKADDGRGGPASLTVILRNVKEHIQQLLIRNSMILALELDDFKGFSSLVKLRLEDNDISGIAPDTFQKLPVLRVIDLGRNEIGHLDWTVLQPVADSLVELYLGDQKPGLPMIIGSFTKFTFRKLTTLQLQNNKLSSIHKEVLETMTAFPDDLSTFTFGGNSFCPSNPDCSCCELKDFFSWVGMIRQTLTEKQEVILSYNCGSGSKVRENLLVIKKTGYRLTAGQGSVKLLDKFNNNTQC